MAKDKAPLQDDKKEYMISLYTEFHRLMFSTVRRITGSSSDCDDIVQESLLRLMSTTDIFRIKEKKVLASYIVTVTTNTTYDYLKKHKRTQEQLCDLEDDELSNIIGDTTSLDDMVLLSERRDLMLNALKKLSYNEQLILKGKYIYGYTDKELAALIKCKPVSIEMKLTRIRRKMLKLMLEMGGEL